MQKNLLKTTLFSKNSKARSNFLLQNPTITQLRAKPEYQNRCIYLKRPSVWSKRRKF